MGETASAGFFGFSRGIHPPAAGKEPESAHYFINAALNGRDALNQAGDLSGDQS